MSCLGKGEGQPGLALLLTAIGNSVAFNNQENGSVCWVGMMPLSCRRKMEWKRKLWLASHGPDCRTQRWAVWPRVSSLSEMPHQQSSRAPPNTPLFSLTLTSPSCFHPDFSVPITHKSWNLFLVSNPARTHNINLLFLWEPEPNAVSSLCRVDDWSSLLYSVAVEKRVLSPESAPAPCLVSSNTAV